MVAAILLLSALATSAGSVAEGFEAKLEAIRARHDLPAMGAAWITKEGTEVWVTGVRRRSAEEKVQQGDRWHLGSNTKAMTATLAAILVEEGQISWDTTIGDVFPSAREEFRSVTLKMLLGHRGGFSPADKSAPEGMTWLEVRALPGTPSEARAEYVRRALEQPPHVKPGSAFVYSNMGYVVAGAMLERKTGKSWEDLMRSLVFERLEMKSAGFGPTVEPWPHRPDGAPVPPGPLADNPPLLGPAGTVHASLRDYAKFLQLHLGSSNLLKPETLRELHSPLAGQEYALGWVVVERPWAGGPALTHAGSNTLNYAVAWLAPKKGFALAVVTNQGGDKAAKACDEVAADLIRTFSQVAR